MAELLSHCMLPTEHGTFQFAVFQDSARPDKLAIAIAGGTTINQALVPPPPPPPTPFFFTCVLQGAPCFGSAGRHLHACMSTRLGAGGYTTAAPQHASGDWAAAARALVPQIADDC